MSLKFVQQGTVVSVQSVTSVCTGFLTSHTTVNSLTKLEKKVSDTGRKLLHKGQDSKLLIAPVL